MKTYLWEAHFSGAWLQNFKELKSNWVHQNFVTVTNIFALQEN